MTAGGSGDGSRMRVPWTTRSPRRLVLGYAVSLLGTVIMAVGVLPLRDQITPLSKGFGFLVVVAVAAGVGGLGPGLVASLLDFLTFNFLYLPPYGTFAIGRPEYVVVLFVFLGLSLLISALLVTIGPGPDGYRNVLVRLQAMFGLTAAALFVHDPERRELQEVTTVGAEPGELTPRHDRATGERPTDRLPLSVGGQSLGLIVLRADGPPLGAASSQVLRAFCDQLALALERDRLLREATKAQVYQQADEVRRSLLAVVSHDLRTPLAAIKTSVTDLLAEDSPREGDYLRDALESIDAETDRLTALIANLLDMSRIERGMLKPRIQGVDLAEALSGSVDRAKRQWRALEFEATSQPEDMIVRCDPVFLDRILSNLLDNAGKAVAGGDAHGIEVRAHGGRGRVVVRVVDHGKGIPPSVHEQLFYPFYQLGARHPRLGTGLGLPIAKGFLEVMGGEIWIEETPGGGATFAFSLPLEAARVPTPAHVSSGAGS